MENLSFNFKLASKIYLKKDFIADMFLKKFSENFQINFLTNSKIIPL